MSLLLLPSGKHWSFSAQVLGTVPPPRSHSRGFSSQANPFRERICRVFSTSPARDSLSFEDFLDLLSVFSDTATPDIKSHYAFRIFGEDPGGSLAKHRALPVAFGAELPGRWGQPRASRACSVDFDDDGTLNREDLSQLVNCLTGEGEDTRLSASEMKQLIDNVSSCVQQGGPSWGGGGGRGEPREGSGLTLSLLPRSWKSPTSTGMEPSTSRSSSTLFPDHRTLPGMTVPPVTSGSGMLWREGCRGKPPPPTSSEYLRIALLAKGTDRHKTQPIPKGLGFSLHPPLPAANQTHCSLSFSSFKIVL